MSRWANAHRGEQVGAHRVGGDEAERDTSLAGGTRAPSPNACKPHFDAGADRVCVQPIEAGLGPGLELLAASHCQRAGKQWKEGDNSGQREVGARIAKAQVRAYFRAWSASWAESRKPRSGPISGRGAGDENRTRVLSLGSCRAGVVLPAVFRVFAGERWCCVPMDAVRSSRISLRRVTLGSRRSSPAERDHSRGGVAGPRRETASIIRRNPHPIANPH